MNDRGDAAILQLPPSAPGGATVAVGRTLAVEGFAGFAWPTPLADEE
ncbi:MAG TPA: hypothetical protein VMV09_08635 [Candidatus Saccharimonadales bacterium]|nr:hypothetical protein [Candidatus Saccharimonadales bacterium]